MCKVCFSRTFRCSRETALHRVLCHSRNRSAVNTSFSAPQIRYPFLRSRPPRRQPRYPSLGALVSPRRFPRTVCILAVAIQLSMRFILLGRAKARWFLERGFPGSVFPRRVGALRHADAQSACLRGMRRTSICKSVRFRSAYNTILRPCVQPFPAAFFLCSQPSSAAFPVYPVPAAAHIPAGRAWSSPARDGSA